ncbi:MAG: MIP/aquaporin family protein, partial [Anaerovoracaceae bacterium]
MESITTRKLVAEFLGTALLVFFACATLVSINSAMMLVIGGPAGGVFAGFGIAMAFGLILMALYYTIGHVSGAHVNPAVSLGMFISGRMNPVEMVAYWISQFAGGIAGTALLWAVLGKREALGANAYGKESMLQINWWQAAIVEVVITFIFVLVFLAVT